MKWRQLIYLQVVQCIWDSDRAYIQKGCVSVYVGVNGSDSNRNVESSSPWGFDGYGASLVIIL